jgi:hypothetical protein
MRSRYAPKLSQICYCKVDQQPKRTNIVHRVGEEKLGWKSISAVRSGSLYYVPRDSISRLGPRLVEALEVLEK